MQQPRDVNSLRWAKDSLARSARHDYPAAWAWAKKSLVLAPNAILPNQAAVQALAGDRDRARVADQCHRLLLLDPGIIENQTAWLHFVSRTLKPATRFQNTPVPWATLLKADPARFLEYLGAYHPTRLSWFQAHWVPQWPTAGSVFQRLATLATASGGGAGPDAFRAAKQALVVAPATPKGLAVMAELNGCRDDAARMATMTERWAMCGWNAPHGITAAFKRLADPERLAGILQVLAARCLSRDDSICAKRLMIAVALLPETSHIRLILPVLPRLDALLGTSNATYIAEAQLAFKNASGRYRAQVPSIPVITSSHPDDPVRDTTPTLSVLVPTGNRLSDLKTTLPSLLGQTREDIEIIFSVHADREGTADWLREKTSTDKRVRIVETIGEFFSKALAVNRSAATARGRFLKIMDCDCRYTRADALSLVLDRLSNSPTSVHSFGYRGMIALRTEAFRRCDGVAVEVKDEQLMRAAQGSTFRSVDDMVLIGDAVALAGCGYIYWRPDSTERVTVDTDGIWSVEIGPPELPKLLDHIGESRVFGGTRQGRFSNLMMKSNDFYTRFGGSALFEAEFTKLRNFVTARRRQRPSVSVKL
jgi:hypothetical protein